MLISSVGLWEGFWEEGAGVVCFGNGKNAHRELEEQGSRMGIEHFMRKNVQFWNELTP